MRRVARRVAQPASLPVAALFLTLWGCEPTDDPARIEPEPPTAADGAVDTAPPEPTPDASVADMMALDSAASDVGAPDASGADAEAPDAGAPDLAVVSDAGPADAGPPDRCARWSGLSDQALIDAVHAELSSTYRPVEPMRFALGQPDPNGEPLRYPTARLLMFTEIEWGPIPEGTGYECAYTGRTFPAEMGVELDDQIVNCEHTWPRDRFDDDPPAFYQHKQSDIHHLLPTDSGVNSARGNLRFGSVTDGPDTDLTHRPAVSGPDASGEIVFMPRRERRGDVARVMFYFAVRWGAAMDPAEHEVLRRWAQRDPVDEREMRRNDLIEGIQGNRNPFIDCPALIDGIDAFPAFEPLDTEDDLPLP